MEIDQFQEFLAKSPAGVICKLSAEEYDGVITKFICRVSKIEGHDVQKVGREAHFHSSIEQSPSRKRESSMSTDQCPSGKRSRSMPNPAYNDVAIAVPASHGMQNNQARNVVMMKNAEAVPNANKLVKTIGVHLSATETLGIHFDEYIKDIWSCLMDDYVFRIGIHVFWINASPGWSIPNRATVSPPCRVCNLQSSISKAVAVDLSEGDDDNKRAAQLSKGLTRKKKSAVILDDVSDYISLLEVGIPVGVDQCTVLFATRSLEVCKELGCQTKIEIGCLLPDESYELFKKNLGCEMQ